VVEIQRFLVVSYLARKAIVCFTSTRHPESATNLRISDSGMDLGRAIFRTEAGSNLARPQSNSTAELDFCLLRGIIGQRQGPESSFDLLHKFAIAYLFRFLDGFSLLNWFLGMS
jgi:hypothetical protein